MSFAASKGEKNAADFDHRAAMQHQRISNINLQSKLPIYFNQKIYLLLILLSEEDLYFLDNSMVGNTNCWKSN